MTSDITVLIALYSLGWFVVGIFIGRHLYYTRERGGSSGSSSRREQPSGSAGGEYEIYVGNLPYEMDERDLNELFAKFGGVSSCRIIKNKFNGKSRGYGFVEMNDGGEVRTAVKALNGREIKGRRIVVNEARSAPRD
ncbi:MAG: hypothetical protein C0404_07570 [Verrucomicrobia bacterium]|nr:hypothetical protein [Verrucomicrobiota bacterium]